MPAGFSVNPRIALTIPMLCHESESEAIERGIDGAHFFGYSLGHYCVYGKHKPAQTNIWEEFQKNRALFGFNREIAAQTGRLFGATMKQGGLGALRGAIGTPPANPRPAARLRGDRHRPDHLRVAGRPEPPRAHL